MDQGQHGRRAVQALSDLARLSAQPAGGALPVRLLSACTVVLGMDGAALTLATTRAERITLAATDDVAASLEDLQDVTGQGPSGDAFDRGEIVQLVPGELNQSRWPHFVAAARGLLTDLSMVSIPIRPYAEVLGVLTSYARPGRSLIHELSTSQLVVNAVGVAVLGDLRTEAPPDLGLSSGSWSNRDAVHQATGMVIAQLGIGPEDAIAVIRAHAYAHDLTLTQISWLILQRQLDFSHPDPAEDG